MCYVRSRIGTFSPLREEKIQVKSTCWYFIGVLFKVSGKHPHLFLLVSPLPCWRLVWGNQEWAETWTSLTWLFRFIFQAHFFALMAGGAVSSTGRYTLAWPVGCFSGWYVIHLPRFHHQYDIVLRNIFDSFTTRCPSAAVLVNKV